MDQAEARTGAVRQHLLGGDQPWRDRFCLLGLATVVTVQVALVWLLPVLPCQDLPQHLAYIRIFADHADNQLFQSTYVLPEQNQPYFTVYRLLAWLAAWIGPVAAVRVALSGYVAGMFASFVFLSRASTHDLRTGVPELACSGLLATLIVWNPVLVMGFLSFALSLPLVLAGHAFLLTWTEARKPLGWLLASVATTLALVSLHPAAAGVLGFLALLHASMNPGIRRATAAVTMVGSVAAGLGVWSLAGATGTWSGAWPSSTALDEAVRNALGLEFVTPLFRISWGTPPTKLGYLLWTLLGPYRLSGQLVVLVPAVVAAALVLRAQSGDRPVAPTHPRRRAARTALALLVAAWLAPWGFFVPTELTFLDLRLFTVALALLLALVPPSRFRPVLARGALVLLALFVTAHFAYRAYGFAQEARPAIALLDKARPPGLLASLVYGNRSAHFGKQFRLTHFLPMYYTVLHGGTNTQFWARYTAHLPIGFRRGARPARPPDWKVNRFHPRQLKDSDFLLVQAPAHDAPRGPREAYRKAMVRIRPMVRQVSCEGDWCLYQVMSRSRRRPQTHDDATPEDRLDPEAVEVWGAPGTGPYHTTPQLAPVPGQ